jgi:DNA-binding transcriptional MerR regulator
MSDPISSPAAAKALGITSQTLRLWRHRGCGPPYVRLSGLRGRCVYDPLQLERWKAERTFNSTSEESVAAGSRR